MKQRPGTTESAAPSSAAVDLRETGAPVDGVPQVSDRRLYMQLQVFEGCSAPGDLVDPLAAGGLEAALYRDLNHPDRIGVLLMTEDPGALVAAGGALLTRSPFAALRRVPGLTMTGRTYSTGYEPDLKDVLLARPRRRVLDPDLPWAIWYPLRRKPAFYRLPKAEQGGMLREHGMIGRTYVEAGHGYDIRLACFGLDEHDNDFVIGLLGADLYPLSRLVQEMRKTQQTAEYVESLGPFFVGKVHWQTASA